MGLGIPNVLAAYFNVACGRTGRIGGECAIRKGKGLDGIGGGCGCGRGLRPSDGGGVEGGLGIRRGVGPKSKSGSNGSHVEGGRGGTGGFGGNVVLERRSASVRLGLGR